MIPFVDIFYVRANLCRTNLPLKDNLQSGHRSSIRRADFYSARELAHRLEPWRRFQFCKPRLHIIERAAQPRA
jgi:hypothetical protein